MNGSTARRSFLQIVGLGAAALGLNLSMQAVEKPIAGLEAAKCEDNAACCPSGRVACSGENLGALAMPIGGIGAGNIWLTGDGRLVAWQIFANNLNDTVVVPSLFAVRAKSSGKEPVVRALQTARIDGITSVESLSFLAEYPMATLQFGDAALPVKVSLAAYNPMIPGNVRDSAIPCAIFELTATNPGQEPVEVSFMHALQNPVGLDGRQSPTGRTHQGYGGNRNVFSQRADGCEFIFYGPSKSSVRTRRSFTLVHVGAARDDLKTHGRLVVKSPQADGALGECDTVWVDVSGPDDQAAIRAICDAKKAGKKLMVNGAYHLLPEIAASRMQDVKGKGAGSCAALDEMVAFIIGANVFKNFPPEFDRATIVPEKGVITRESYGTWRYTRRLDVKVSDCGPSAYNVLEITPDGKPLALFNPMGNLTLILADDLPTLWGVRYIEYMLGSALRATETPPQKPGTDGIALSTTSTNATAEASWTDLAALVADLTGDGTLSGRKESEPSPMGETVNGALAVPLLLGPGETKSVTFILSWYFPAFERFGHTGMMYETWYSSAADVAADVRKRLPSLREQTRLYHDAIYESNLPYWCLQRLTSQSSIIRGVTCFWAKENALTGTDYFAGDEGSFACCPLNCSHVWGYAQSHAFLFPEIARNMRQYDLTVYLMGSGQIRTRQQANSFPCIDGHLASITAAYREHLMSADNRFLKSVWPGTKRAMDWAITMLDPDGDGVTSGFQWDTYDSAVTGANTFIGSYYLAALASAEKMAQVMGERRAAARYAKIWKAGGANQERLLWNGDYFIQTPESQEAENYNTGCHSDQLIGQWWSHVLGTGSLYSNERVRGAAEAIFKHNYKADFTNIKQSPRKFVPAGKGGLLNCTWPNGGRPKRFTYDADEAWTGVEYEVAALLMYEGRVDEALTVIKAIDDRYSGRKTEIGIGNPFCEVECGNYYARALSSWSVLLAAQGYIYDGPRQLIGFTPHWKPEDHVTFFTAPNAWGLFKQKRSATGQSDEIAVRWGQLPISEMVLSLPPGVGQCRVTAKLRDVALPVRLHQNGTDCRLRFKHTVMLSSTTTLSLQFHWE